jgi:hypothetical protein
MMQDALAQVGLYWHQNIMPGHFEQGAAAKYAYAPRTRKFMITKARKKGHQRPLTFTGVSENLASLWPKIKKSEARVTVILPNIPRYFYYTAVTGKRQPNKMFELGRVRPDEAQKMSEMYARLVEGKMNEDTSVVFHGAGGLSSGAEGEGPWSPETFQAQ